MVLNEHELPNNSNEAPKIKLEKKVSYNVARNGIDTLKALKSTCPLKELLLKYLQSCKHFHHLYWQIVIGKI